MYYVVCVDKRIIDSDQVDIVFFENDLCYEMFKFIEFINFNFNFIRCYFCSSFCMKYKIRIVRVLIVLLFL